MDQQERLIEEIKILERHIDSLTKRYSKTHVFVIGMINGIGFLIGATLLVLVGSVILNLLGLFPEFSDIAEVIKNAFAQSHLR